METDQNSAHKFHFGLLDPFSDDRNQNISKQGLPENLNCTFRFPTVFQLSRNFIGIFPEPGIPKIYQFQPLPMALGIVGIGIGIKTEFALKLS